MSLVERRRREPDPGLVRYEAMCRAISECASVDEAQDIRNKSLALEAYYRQARNLDAEREAANVRLRAERRVGELLKELARATPAEAGAQGGRGNEKSPSAEDTGFAPSPYAAALEQNGISRQTAHRFQALAEVPKERFELALSAPEKPTTASVLERTRARAEVHDPIPRPTVSDDALALWGTMRDFERHGLLDADVRLLLAGMTDAMRADVRRLAPRISDLLASLEQSP